MIIEISLDTAIITEQELFELALKKQKDILDTACKKLDKKDTEENQKRYTKEYQKYEYLKWKIGKIKTR